MASSHQNDIAKLHDGGTVPPHRFPGGTVLIVHLSDIHFKRADFTTVHDPNFFLRSEILRDLRISKGKLGPADLVIVSGDIAFAGQTDEFEFATEWLKEACDACGADFRNVFVVPGNHDVDRKVADEVLVRNYPRGVELG